MAAHWVGAMRNEFENIPAEILDAFGFAGASSRRFEVGAVNRQWLVTLGERRCVAGCYLPERSLAAIDWEQGLVAHAATRDWPVAVAMPARDGRRIVVHEGRAWAAAPFLSGEARHDDTPAAFHVRGRLLARLHCDLASFPVEGQRPGTGKTWELDTLVEPANAGSFNDLLAAFAREYPDLASLIRGQRYRSLRELSRLKYPDLPDRPIHGDFHRSNLLWEQGQLTGVIDFDLCRRDALLCDLALQLMPFRPLARRFAAALLDGYQSVRPLTDSEWLLLTPLTRASLLSWVAFLLVRWRLEGVEPAGVARTMTVRFPAFEAAEPGYQVLRADLQQAR